jgi:hypothetical protein
MIGKQDPISLSKAGMGKNTYFVFNGNIHIQYKLGLSYLKLRVISGI